jgi:mRNA-degrading endonuclease RelE of RelBE toxin-antitoxin system
MSYEVIPTPTFEKQVKKIAKKYPKFKDDLRDFVDNLKENPFVGDSLKDSCYKVRIKITGKQSGKSGGARIITHVKVIDECVFLLSVYDKSYKEDLEEGELDKLLNDMLD